MSVIPYTRTLPYVLRERLQPSSVSVLIGRVVSAPDSRHVRVTISGSDVTVPKLASYATPVAGEPCYVLFAADFTIALGTCK
jgi:hypothetical protein